MRNQLKGVKVEVCWVMDGLQKSESGAYRCDLASNRYRGLIPVRGLGSSGISVKFASFLELCRDSVEYQVYVIGKFLPSPGSGVDNYRTVLAKLEDLRQQGRVIVADFCDDHFERARDGDYWRGLASLASFCVAGSSEMADRVRQYAGGDVHVIPDPVGAPGGAPAVFQRDTSIAKLLKRMMPGAAKFNPLRLVWYGHPSNFNPLIPWVDALLAAEWPVPIMLWVVTQPHPKIRAWSEAVNQRRPGAVVVDVIEWSEEAQWDIVRDANVVLLPSDPSDLRKSVKTANRLIDALAMGRYVIASKLPSYLEFSDHASLVEGGPVGALHDYLAAPERALAKIQSGQRYVNLRHGPEAVGKLWADVLSLPVPTDNATKRDKIECGATTATPIRLNIGCGDKLLPGYVNVDIVESRAGVQPDVISDIRELSCFPDHYADEVLAVHVIEHFWRWEVEDVVREWIRVLKPGGRLVLECPNLQTACEMFLADPDNGARADQMGQRTMWVFYGDPKWKDPLMVHRWGYTPASLSGMLSNLGLRNVRQEPAQFKLKEPRDMRIVAEKPYSNWFSTASC